MYTLKFYAEKTYFLLLISRSCDREALQREGLKRRKSLCFKTETFAIIAKPSNSREGKFTTNKCNFSPSRFAASLYGANDGATSIIKSHFTIAVQFTLSAKFAIFKARELREYRPPFPSPSPSPSPPVLSHSRARKSIHGVGSSLIAIITPLSDAALRVRGRNYFPAKYGWDGNGSAYTDGRRGGGDGRPD